MKSSIFWDITACSPLKVNVRFPKNLSLLSSGSKKGQARNHHEACNKQSSARYQLHPAFMKRGATCSFETSPDFQRTTWRYILEDRTLNINTV
jgi:hypothetical protein